MALSESFEAAAIPGCGLGITTLPRMPAETTGAGRALVLEASDAGLDPFLPLLRRDFDVWLIHAPRRADPRRYGRPLEHGHWFVGPPETPDPHGLCNALEALESLLLQPCEPGDSAPVLIGSGCGATLALALASCWGDRLRAVVAIGGVLPLLPQEVERAEIEGLPVLWLGDPSFEIEGRASLSSELATRGARITREPSSFLDASPESLSTWLRASLSSVDGRRAGASSRLE